MLAAELHPISIPYHHRRSPRHACHDSRRALAEKQLADPSQRIHKVLETARVLYGLIHARYILTAQGLSDMVRTPPPSPLGEHPDPHPPPRHNCAVPYGTHSTQGRG